MKGGGDPFAEMGRQAKGATHAGGPPEQGGYGGAPTPDDAAQSVVHHADSVDYNLRHAKAHASEALRHSLALKDRLDRADSVFDRHSAALRNAADSERDESPGDERSEPPALERVERKAGVERGAVRGALRQPMRRMGR